MFTAYVLENPKGKRYTGSTGDIVNRLRIHNDTSPGLARFHRTTYKDGGPWEIVFSRDFPGREDAVAFEKYLKTGKGREFLRECLEHIGNGE